MIETQYKTCTRCKKSLAFWSYNHIKRTGKLRAQCKSCEYTARRRNEREIVAKNSCYMQYNPDSLSIRGFFS